MEANKVDNPEVSQKQLEIDVLEDDKLYYTIGEVSKMFKVNASLIRFWEKEFDVLKPKKNKKGNRLFTKDDVSNLRLIYHLVKERGYTLQGARVKLKSAKSELVNQTVSMILY